MRLLLIIREGYKSIVLNLKIEIIDVILREVLPKIIVISVPKTNHADSSTTHQYLFSTCRTTTTA